MVSAAIAVNGEAGDVAVAAGLEKKDISFQFRFRLTLVQFHRAALNAARAAAKLTREFVSLRHLNKSTWLDGQKFNSLAPRLRCLLARIM